MVKMSMPSRRELLKKAKNRYLKSSLKEKTKILDELCANTGYHRKYATRKLSPRVSLREQEERPRKKRKCFYTNFDIYWLAKIWKIMDYPCGQRLAPNLSGIIDKLVHFKELAIPENTGLKLKKISSASIDNRLKKSKRKLRRKIASTTRPGSLVKKQIPLRTSSWDEKKVGFCELDTVPHCGNTAAGDFINSLNLTDILTQWTEGAAIMGRAQKRVMQGLDDIKTRLPFSLKGIDPDNGAEFINWQLIRYCFKRQIDFTRGRPYHKNDNAHIEQKNWTHVRKIFGYRRLETERQKNLMNDLYQNELRLYLNFFIPNVKLIEKRRMGKYGEKIKRVYDQAKTPYQRVMECEQVDEITKQKLKEQYDQLNPAELRRKILLKLDHLLKIK